MIQVWSLKIHLLDDSSLFVNAPKVNVGKQINELERSYSKS